MEPVVSVHGLCKRYGQFEAVAGIDLEVQRGEIFPVEHLSDGLHKAYAPHVHGAGIVWSDIGVLALWAAVGLTVALVRFSRLPQAAGA